MAKVVVVNGVARELFQWARAARRGLCVQTVPEPRTGEGAGSSA
jgi:hypothetical protein